MGELPDQVELEVTFRTDGKVALWNALGGKDTPMEIRVVSSEKYAPCSFFFFFVKKLYISGTLIISDWIGVSLGPGCSCLGNDCLVRSMARKGDLSTSSRLTHGNDASNSWYNLVVTGDLTRFLLDR